MIIVKCIPGKYVSHFGEIAITEFEGGFAPDDIRIGEVNLAELLIELFGIEPDSRGSISGLDGVRKLPAVRITIECDEVAARPVDLEDML